MATKANRKRTAVRDEVDVSKVKINKVVEKASVVTSKYFSEAKSTPIKGKQAALKSQGEKTSKKTVKEAKGSSTGEQTEAKDFNDVQSAGNAGSSNAETKTLKQAVNEIKPDLNVKPAAGKTQAEDISGAGSQIGRVDFKFYDRSCEDLAKALLGQIVVTTFEGKRLAGKIVETEAYLGRIDKAAHSYKGKTDRNAAMFMQPGTAYVYNIYGMYCCLNISAQGDGNAVLIRSLQPVENLEIMNKLRSKGKKETSLLKKEGRDLCNGPSKLCQALGIRKEPVNKQDLCTSDLIWLEKGDNIDSSKIVVSKRINIAYAEDWIDKPLRFYILGNNFVSVRDKIAEKDM